MSVKLLDNVLAEKDKNILVFFLFCFFLQCSVPKINSIACERVL